MWCPCTYLCVSVGGGGPLCGFPFFSTQAWYRSAHWILLSYFSSSSFMVLSITSFFFFFTSSLIFSSLFFFLHERIQLNQNSWVFEFKFFSISLVACVTATCLWFFRGEVAMTHAIAWLSCWATLFFHYMYTILSLSCE